jgi:hypothetical protein
MGLDTTTAPFYVAPNNAVAQQNVAINRQYGVYSTAQGRIANVMSSAIAQPVIGVGVTSYITTVSTLYYYPGLYVLVGTVGGSVTAYYAGVGSIPAVITNWAVTNHVANFSVNLYESKFVFAQSYVFVDCPIVKPQMIVGTQISFGTNAINWGIVGPTGTVGTAATGSGALNGYYSYAVTFVNTSFTPPLESSPNAFPALVYAVGQNIAISAIPVSSDTQVTARNIYRIGGTIGGTPLLVHTIADNTTTSYTDTLADSSVVGQQLILRQDPAPANGWCSIAYHKGRMWGLGSNPNGIRFTGSDLWYSNYLQYTSFNSVTQVLDCGSDFNDLPVALASLDSVLVILKQASIWLCYGDTQNDFITRRTFSVGCMSKGSVASGYGKVFWLGTDGIYYFDGANSPVNISDGNIPSGSVRTLLNQVYTAVGNNFSSPNVCTAGFIINRTYYLSFYSLSSTFAAFTLGYDLDIGAWTYLPYGTNAVGVCRNSFENGAGTQFVFGTQLAFGASTSTSGQVDQWFGAETDKGSSIVSSWTSNVSDSGMTSITKQYRYIEVVAPTQAQTLNVTLYVNPGPNQTTYGPYAVALNSGAPRNRISLPPGAVGYECMLYISATTSTQTIINKVSVLGYVKRVASPPPLMG